VASLTVWVTLRWLRYSSDVVLVAVVRCLECPWVRECVVPVTDRAVVAPPSREALVLRVVAVSLPLLLPPPVARRFPPLVVSLPRLSTLSPLLSRSRCWVRLCTPRFRLSSPSWLARSLVCFWRWTTLNCLACKFLFFKSVSSKRIANDFFSSLEDEEALRAKVDEALSVYDEYMKNKGEGEAPAESAKPKEDAAETATEENKS
jgi:hypothetical protein